MIVTCGGSRHIVDDVRANRFVIVVPYVVHFGILESQTRQPSDDLDGAKRWGPVSAIAIDSMTMSPPTPE